MITRKRTTIKLSEVQCLTLELVARKLGIEKPTTTGMLAILIASRPEFTIASNLYDKLQKELVAKDCPF